MSLDEQINDLKKVWGADWIKRLQSYCDHDWAEGYVEADLEERDFMWVDRVGIEHLVGTDTYEWLRIMAKTFHYAESIKGFPELYCRPFREFKFRFFIDIKLPTTDDDNLEAVQFYHNIRRKYPVLYVMFRPKDEQIQSVWAHEIAQHPEWNPKLAYWKGAAPHPDFLSFLQRQLHVEKPIVYTRPPPPGKSGELHIKLNKDARKFQRPYQETMDNLYVNLMEIQRRFESCKMDISQLDASLNPRQL